MKKLVLMTLAAAAVSGCGHAHRDSAQETAVESGVTHDARLPLLVVRDIELPGRPNRFDYQDIDAVHGRLFIAHMHDASVVAVNLASGNVAAVVPNIPTARGIVVAPEVGRVFVTSSPNQVVVIDDTSLREVARVSTGRGPDGIAWDPIHRIVGVSDQSDGAVSLLQDGGNGGRVAVRLGEDTGNVVFDRGRASFWVTVVPASGPDQLVAIDPMRGAVTTRIDLPGCDGAHGLRLHPDGNAAFVACEGNSMLVRVALDGDHALTVVPTGAGPDVLSIDPGLGWLYVAAESGDLTVFDITGSRLTRVGAEHPADSAHTVAVDPATHRVYFPLTSGANGKPTLRIMRPRVD